MGTGGAGEAGAPRTPDRDLLVFISYRREDSAGHAGRLYDDLVRRFSADDVFVDVDTIPPGVEFPDAIRKAVGSCRALVALIGPRWLAATGPGGARRLDDAGDYVRLEIQTALERDVLVVPVLLQGAQMPKARDLPAELKPLARRNAMQMRDASWRSDFEALATGLERLAATTGSSGLRGDHEAFWTLPPAEVELPFLGLRAFEEDDARFYFGREDDVAELVDRLRRDRFLAVFGPSGSGKSSLVRAGLTKALRDGAIEGSKDWLIETVRPGPHPLETFAARLHRLHPRRSAGDLVDALAADPRTLHLETLAALADRPPGTRLVWIVDQAEELFTVAAEEPERAAAIANLVHAATVEGGRCDVVFAMRADFFQRCATYPELAAAVSRSQYLVSPMTEAAIRRAIEEPARAVGLAFEPGLVDTILQDFAAQPGALPLLEHALFELFQRRRGKTLTLEGYRATGGVQGALARRAETVYDGLDGAEQALVRRVMVRLTQPGEGTVDTRRRSPLSDLLARPAEAGPINHLIDELASARLVTLGAGDEAGEPVVEIAHEALIRAWPRVRTWLEQDREALRIQRRIADAASEWERLGRAPEALFRGVRLTEAQEWRERNAEMLNASEEAFLAASAAAAGQEAAARERQRRRFLFASVSVALFFVILSGLTFVAWRGSEDARAATAEALARAESEKQRADANVVEVEQQRRLAVARGLVSEARQPETPFEVQLLLGLEARRFGGAEANELILSQLAEWPDLVRALPAPAGADGRAAARSPDLETVAYVVGVANPGSPDVDAIIVRNVVSGAERELARMTVVFQLGFSPDGASVIASGTLSDGRQGVALWRVADGAPTFLDTGSWPEGWSFSADGTRVAIQRSVPLADGGTKDSMVIWERATGKEVLAVPLPVGSVVLGTALSAHGERFVMERDRGAESGTTIDIWDVATGASRHLHGEGSAASNEPTLMDTTAFHPTFAFSPGADRLAIVTPAGDSVDQVELWRVDGEPARVFELQFDDFDSQAVAVSGDGSSFVLAGDRRDGQPGIQWARVVGFGGELAGEATFLPSPIHLDSVRFDEGDGRIIGQNGRGQAVVWERSVAPEPRSASALPPDLANTAMLAAGPGGAVVVLSRVAVVGSPGPFTMELVDTATGRHRSLPAAYQGAVVISADGHWLAHQTPGGVGIDRLDGLEVTGAAAATTRFAEFTRAIAISPDGSTVAVASVDDAQGIGPGFLSIVDARSGTVLATKSTDDRPTSLAFAPDGASIAIAATDRQNLDNEGVRTTIRTWTWSTGDMKALGKVPAEVDSMAFSADGATLTFVQTSLGLVSGLRGDTGLLTSAMRIPEIVEAGLGGTSNLAMYQPRIAADGDTVVTAGLQVLIWPRSQFEQPVETRVCELVGRNLTTTELQRYLPDEYYEGTCFKSLY